MAGNCWGLRSYTVRGGGVERVTDNDASVKDIDVQRMVDHIHVVGCGEGTRDSVNAARERGGCDTERCLPNLKWGFMASRLVEGPRTTYHWKLRENIVYAPICVGASIEKNDNSLSAIDQLSKSGPLREPSERNSCSGHKRALTSLHFMSMEGGTYAICAIPEAWKAGSQTLGKDTPSGFVNNNVITSFGFAWSQVCTVVR